MDDKALKILHSLDSEKDSKSSGSPSKPQNWVGDGFKVTRSKRKLNTSHPEPPRKRQRGSSNTTETTFLSGTGGATPQIKQTSRNNNDKVSELTEVSVEGLTVNGSVRKASPEIEPPRKRQRGENTDNITGELTTHVPVENVSETESKKVVNAEQLTRRETGSEVSPSSGRPSTSQQNSGRTYPVNTSRANLEAKYLQHAKLGEGGFGSVYAGRRKADNFPVAIKRIPKVDVKTQKVFIHGRIFEVPTEVRLMLRAAGGPQSVGKFAAVSLLDWYDLDHEAVLVMERPVPSVDLLHYLYDHGPLKEAKVKVIMKQLVEAAIEILSIGVFHRDIKTQNVLIQRHSRVPRVRLIDFGCGCFVKKGSYHRFFGTYSYAPPEFYTNGKYKAGPTTVWQLGALTYELLDGYKIFNTSKFLQNEIIFDSKLSHDCKDFLRVCLDLNPRKRATLEQMQQHPWFA